MFCARYVNDRLRHGVVHIAPGHGLETTRSGSDNGIEIYSPIDDDGKYADDGRVPPNSSD